MNADNVNWSSVGSDSGNTLDPLPVPSALPAAVLMVVARGNLMSMDVGMTDAIARTPMSVGAKGTTWPSTPRHDKTTSRITALIKRSQHVVPVAGHILRERGPVVFPKHAPGHGCERINRASRATRRFKSRRTFRPHGANGVLLLTRPDSCAKVP